MVNPNNPPGPKEVARLLKGFIRSITCWNTNLIKLKTKLRRSGQLLPVSFAHLACSLSLIWECNSPACSFLLFDFSPISWASSFMLQTAVPLIQLVAWLTFSPNSHTYAIPTYKYTPTHTAAVPGCPRRWKHVTCDSFDTNINSKWPCNYLS